MGSRGVESPTAHLYDDGVLGAEAKAHPSPSSTHGTPLDSVGDVLRGIGGLGSDSQGTTLWQVEREKERKEGNKKEKAKEFFFRMFFAPCFKP